MYRQELSKSFLRLRGVIDLREGEFRRDARGEDTPDGLEREKEERRLLGVDGATSTTSFALFFVLLTAPLLGVRGLVLAACRGLEVKLKLGTPPLYFPERGGVSMRGLNIFCDDDGEDGDINDAIAFFCLLFLWGPIQGLGRVEV